MKQNKIHNWQKEHNMRVAAFHKRHVQKIERGENGKGLLAKSEKFVFNLVKTRLNIVELHKKHVSERGVNGEGFIARFDRYILKIVKGILK